MHTAVLLPSNRVLVVGRGADAYGPADATAEMYDPGTGTWTEVPAPDLSIANTATVLPSGKVLVTGSCASHDFPVPSCYDVFDPDTATWIPAHMFGNIEWWRPYGATLTPLLDGTALLAGGSEIGVNDVTRNIAAVYESSTNSFGPIAGMNSPRRNHTAVLLPSGMVLVAGGEADIGGTSNHLVVSAELYDPDVKTWSWTESMNYPRYRHTAVLLPSRSKVLVAGGARDDMRPGGYHVHSSSELYDLVSATWTVGPPMSTPRVGHTATVLDSGEVLVVGGANDEAGCLATSEIYRE